jgi:very-short-patch-repair endonuclease
MACDRTREVFQAEGDQLVRVQNDDVYKHINDVLDMILMGLEGRL